jgi:predicted short-subunit dehydrogenase-like oxidoreductase (DUF2520 family)
MEIKTVTIIGAGKVGASIGKALKDAGVQISGIYSRTAEKTKALAFELDTQDFDTIAKLPASDLYLLCVPDNSIVSIIPNLPHGCNIAYTAGAVKLPPVADMKKIGVFYPLQTFSENRTLNIDDIPFHIESEDSYLQQNLFDLAWKISKKVTLSTYSQRLQLHIAAVFTNNFTNHLLVLAANHCKENSVDFTDLHPLLIETVNKVIALGPENAQTGPAIRNDTSTISAHELQLSGRTKEIYQLITQSIKESNKLC